MPTRSLRSVDDLRLPFLQTERPRSHWTIGTEIEKIGVYTDGKTVPFLGDKSISTVLGHLLTSHGYVETPEYPGGPLIALKRGKASITLEPGAQLELSGAPLDTIHETYVELMGHRAELQRIGSTLGIAWLGIGFHPFARREELNFIPKLRYEIMQSYLPTRGSYGLDMMGRTCTVQANLDYSDVGDAFRKLRVGLRSYPIVSALFGNSPYEHGRFASLQSRRTQVWTSMDPDRSGFLADLWHGEADYDRYIEWALDVPMFLVKRGQRLVRNAGQTFRSFMKDGAEGEIATLEDWDTHLNTLFPEVRLKRTLEFRAADAASARISTALPALWKGLLYDARATAEAEALLAEVTAKSVSDVHALVAEQGLSTVWMNRPLWSWADDLVRIAAGGLTRLGNLDGTGNDESIYLEPLREFIGAKKNFAALAVDVLGENPSPAQIISHFAY